MTTVSDSTMSISSSALLALLDQAQLHSGACLYSIIDGAQLAQMSAVRLSNRDDVQVYSLLGVSAAHDAMYAGPLLLSHSRRERCSLLCKLLAMPGSANFLSLLVSRQALESLIERLSWLTDVVHEDGTEWVMRYYDPRIFPHWLDVLDSEQKGIALGGIDQWLFTDERGRAHAIYGSADAAHILVDDKPMLMTESQSSRLMDKALPYMMMSLLVADDPGALSAVPPHQRYDFFAKQLADASGYALNSVEDLKIYCLLALLLGSEFTVLPLVAEALDQPRTGPSFSARVLGWTPRQWATLN